MTMNSIVKRFQLTPGNLLIVSGLLVPLLLFAVVYASVGVLSRMTIESGEPFMDVNDWNLFRSIVINVQALYLVGFTSCCLYAISRMQSGSLILLTGVVVGIYWGWFLKP